jgi:hypothetical protein
LASISVRSLSHWGMFLCKKVNESGMSEPDIATEVGKAGMEEWEARVGNGPPADRTRR